VCALAAAAAQQLFFAAQSAIFPSDAPKNCCNVGKIAAILQICLNHQDTKNTKTFEPPRRRATSGCHRQEGR
jgi:hypothetical protein